ncbi:diguanylate cyclase [Endozoicomonas sp. SM1973]|uniref:diguanylate cyclase n=1 Tax=Spartinivicinus marinus TaxID=2994442 RepID=A0A853IFV8_9GAMM|nr:diguanylate cyclase [Spartinivicinus marinus]MCX4025341.1 diguanylate cyclase [Spartinivicinus marinus]NYZ68914.1 diguanylate cyclase [Spartinivicinus marinus]
MKGNAVLIVEDSPMVLKVLKHLFETKQELSPVFAATLSEAELYLSKPDTPYLVAVVDLNLPDAPNGEVVNKVLAVNVPCIVLSGSYNDKKREALLDKGVVDYVLKESRYSYEYVVKLISRLQKNQFIKVLVVDDSKSTRAFIRKTLKQHLYQVLEAEDGIEALAMLQQQPDIRLMVVDYNMPNMNGYELVKNIRHKQNNKNLIIIGLSAEGSGALSAKFIKNGANDFLRKPFYHEELHCRLMHNLEEMELFEAVKDAANRDYLTGLFNRRYFFQVAEKLYENAVEHNKPLSLAMLDIDHFKQINDSYGHEVGDYVLTKLADVLKEKFARFTVARLGGEEFCVLLSGLDIDKSQQLLDNFRCLVAEQKLAIGGIDLGITISIGVTDNTYSSLSDMLAIADKCLYRAKQAGRNLLILD